MLVLDDFHYAATEVQMHIAQQLKDAIRREFKAIVVSLPHRSDDAIRKNPDLTGRLSLINIGPWNIQELKEISITGFAKLNIKIQDSMAESISVESLTSPQLMQYICLSICTLLDTDTKEIREIPEIPEEILSKAYKFTTLSFEYAIDVEKVLRVGPNTRGNSRGLFRTTLGKALDIYGLIIEAISSNSPIMGLTLDDIKFRIDELIVDSEQKPNKQGIRECLNKLQNILNEKENIYKVLEWKDNKLYILDPLFLFYLRWSKH
ncbi:MAG: hypothetical protein MR639_14820 [Clostridium sp.]|uniref:hypothetical protein n=1 Tax=Clostridium sp. TaxID=1506 RepID=UPI002A8D93EF|nr:hypothetical protein [Clostridium sp.]MDY5098565.1 hypothetical protein [Clostridium sp.]